MPSLPEDPIKQMWNSELSLAHQTRLDIIIYPSGLMTMLGIKVVPLLCLRELSEHCLQRGAGTEIFEIKIR